MQPESLPPFINESGRLAQAPPALMDRLWSQGWRHFGTEFFRYSITAGEDGALQVIQPLRIPLDLFQPSKSQRRVLRRNEDTDIRVVPAVVDEERAQMFLRHRERFTFNIPESIQTFIPAEQPCELLCVEVRAGGRLIAVSYMDHGAEAVSSVYAFFEPGEAERSPGTLTLLAEILWAQQSGKRWLYPGYATVQPSHYDYKKQFRPLEYFDWRGAWLPL